MESSTLIGCVPILGTVIGIKRIVEAFDEAENYKVRNATSSIWEALEATGGREEVFHGACELVPVFGPMFYGFTHFCLSRVAKTPESTPLLREGEQKSISMKGIKTREELQKHIRKQIEIRVSRFADEIPQHSFLVEMDVDRIRDSHGSVDPQIVHGTLISVGNPQGKRERYLIVLEGADGTVKNYVINDTELATLNK